MDRAYQAQTRTVMTEMNVRRILATLESPEDVSMQQRMKGSNVSTQGSWETAKTRNAR